MIVDMISDLHGYYPELEGGDLLIICGDLTAQDTLLQHGKFIQWLSEQKYRKKIFIGGNHDNWLDKTKPYKLVHDPSMEYLFDSGTKFEGFKIWGSPWTKTFEGMNPECKAFTYDTEEELAAKWALIPDDVDILITHSPPKAILDWNRQGLQCGSSSLLEKSRKLKNLKLFVFGHIHEAYSMINIHEIQKNTGIVSSQNNPPDSLPIIVNCSHVNEHYEPVNQPIRVIL